MPAGTKRRLADRRGGYVSLYQEAAAATTERARRRCSRSAQAACLNWPVLVVDLSGRKLSRRPPRGQNSCSKPRALLLRVRQYRDAACRGATPMTGSFDFTPLFAPGLPAGVVKWTGAPRYNFTGGNNDADQVPVEGLIAAADTVLRREGRTLATYGLASGPQGYRPLRQFLAAKLERDAQMSCTLDDILIVSGSLQALDLVNGALLAKGDTVILE